MKKLTVLLFILLLPACLPAQPDSSRLTEQQEAAVAEVVNSWFETAMQGKDLNRLMQLSAVPFTIDRGEVMATEDELRELFLDMFESKGQRAVPKYTFAIKKSTATLEKGAFTKIATVELELVDEDGDPVTILFYVQLEGNTCKVAGMLD